MHIHQLYINAARALQLRFSYYEEYAAVEIFLGGKRYIFRGGQTPFNDLSSSDLSRHKYWVNYILRQAGLPVVDAIIISKDEYLKGNWELPYFDYPVVDKPTINPYGCGRDVFCNIKNKKTLTDY